MTERVGRVKQSYCVRSLQARKTTSTLVSSAMIRKAGKSHEYHEQYQVHLERISI